MRAIREAERPDPAVAPWLVHDPCHRVFAIFGFRQIFAEYALRAIAAPAVLQDKGIAMAGKDLCKLGLRAPCLIGRREVRVVGAVRVLWGSLRGIGRASGRARVG